jgi:PAS domain S-box-containing protein
VKYRPAVGLPLPESTSVTEMPKSAVPTAAELGVDALAAVVERSRDGIVVVTADRRYVYANPAACQIMGYSLAELRALPDFLNNFPEREHQAMLEHFAEQLAGTTGLWTSTLLRADGTEREITWTNMSFAIGGRPHGAAIFRDITDARLATRNAAALGQTAAQRAGRIPLSTVLSDLARHAVEGTRAVACAIGIAGEDGALRAGGAEGVPDEFRRVSLLGTLRIIDMPDGDIVLGGRMAVIPDAKRRWMENCRAAATGLTLQPLDWQVSVHVPLSWGDEVIGVLGVFLPSTLSGPTEAELAVYTALAEQAVVAVVNDRLLAETGETSVLRERARLARELHDSVSQALFSITLHARTAQLAIAKRGLPDDGPLGRSIAQVSELTQGALAEMRALIFELRPEALAAEGLVAAVGKQASALSARSGLIITVDGPGSPLAVEPQVEEHLYRIVLEALNNAVKHARATHAAVQVARTGGRLLITVSDDGVGFDVGRSHPGHLGLGTMRERAGAIGAELSLGGAGDRGTTVTVALDAPAVTGSARVR